MSTYVWMLSGGEPQQADDVDAFVAAQLQDPYILQAPGLLRALLVWWLSWVWRRRMLTTYKQLPGPSPVDDHLNTQATLLARHLGKGYICQPVFRYRAPNTEKAAAVIGRGDRVVLLPMVPHRCAAVSSAVVAANTHLSGRRASVTSVPSYPDFTGYVEAVAETVRAAIADLPAEHHTTYEVLFYADLPAEDRRGTPAEEHRDEIRRTVSAVVDRTGLVRPHHTGYASDRTRIRDKELSAQAQLAALVGRAVPAVVVVPVAMTHEQVGTVVGLDQELAQQAAEGGVVFVRAETVATRPTFIRALAALIRQAERDAEWGS